MAEVLVKAIREEEHNKLLFRFIENAILSLDNSLERISEFHLLFLIELSKFLGFYPSDNYDDRNRIFDLYEGKFISHLPEHLFYIPERTSQYLHKILETLNKGTPDLKIPAIERKELLHKLLDYYQIHINNFGAIKSIKVLETVFS